jgi:hypothetical protein
MTKNLKKQFNDHGATLAGVLVALANAWITIDWNSFEFTDGNIMKLSLSGVIALGGYFSRFKTPINKDQIEQ